MSTKLARPCRHRCKREHNQRSRPAGSAAAHDGGRGRRSRRGNSSRTQIRPCTTDRCRRPSQLIVCDMAGRAHVHPPRSGRQSALRARRDDGCQLPQQHDLDPTVSAEQRNRRPRACMDLVPTGTPSGPAEPRPADSAPVRRGRGRRTRGRSARAMLAGGQTESAPAAISRTGPRLPVPHYPAWAPRSGARAGLRHAAASPAAAPWPG